MKEEAVNTFIVGNTLTTTTTTTRTTTTQNMAIPWLTIESTNEVSMSSVASDKNKEVAGKSEEPDQGQLIPVIGTVSKLPFGWLEMVKIPGSTNLTQDFFC